MIKAKRGGARPGAGRPKGQGRYGEATNLMRIPVSMIEMVRNLVEKKKKSFALPLYTMPVEAGTPGFTDSDDYELYNINDKFMVNNPDDCFLVKVSGYSMKDAGILPDDLLLVDRKKEASDGNIIVASIDNGAVVKRLSIRDGVTTLISDNKDYPNLEDEGQDLHLWGVVTRIIRQC